MPGAEQGVESADFSVLKSRHETEAGWTITSDNPIKNGVGGV
jgi:hypothetical protein